MDEVLIFPNVVCYMCFKRWTCNLIITYFMGSFSFPDTWGNSLNNYWSFWFWVNEIGSSHENSFDYLNEFPMTFWTHALINNFTGKNAHQDSNCPLNTAGYIRKWICIHNKECLHQEPIAKRQWGDAGVQLHTMLGQIWYNFRFGVCSPDPGRTTHISACDPWSRDQVTFCTPSPSHRSRSPISQIIVDLHLLHQEQTLVGPAQDCCPADNSQASDWLKTLAEVPTNPTGGHPPQLWVEGPRWRSGGVVAVGPQGFDSSLIWTRGCPHHFQCLFTSI